LSILNLSIFYFLISYNKMKLIAVGVITLILILYLIKREKFAPINAADVFKQIDIPDASKDPYYQKIKTWDFDCYCGEGKERVGTLCKPVCASGQNRFTNGECYGPCPAGQTRFPNAICYGQCPVGETRDSNGVCQCNSGTTRHTNGICYGPCPADQKRDPNGVCQCIQNNYESYISKDVPGNDIRCLDKPSNFESCKVECNNDPNCKAYNLIYQNGSWGAGWGCCLKNVSTIPTANANKIDYFRKLEGTVTKDSNGVCYPPCPVRGQTRINGVCQCPGGQSLVNGVCQCPGGQSLVNGVCQCPGGQISVNGVCQCPAEQSLVNGVCQWNPCPVRGQTRSIITGACLCPEGQISVNGVCVLNPCSVDKILVNGVCVCDKGLTLNYDGTCTYDPFQDTDLQTLLAQGGWGNWALGW
jgi:hypothetical protein